MPNNATVITTSMMPYTSSAASLAAAATQAAAAAGAAPSPVPGSVAVGGMEENVLPGGMSTAAEMLNGVSPVLPTGQVGPACARLDARAATCPHASAACGTPHGVCLSHDPWQLEAGTDGLLWWPAVPSLRALIHNDVWIGLATLADCWPSLFLIPCRPSRAAPPRCSSPPTPPCRSPPV